MIRNGHDHSTDAKRRLSGLKAKRAGQSFEEEFELACIDHGIKATRMPDGCKRVGPKKLVQIPTPFDWILSHKGRVALIDTKTDARNFPHSKIKEHQVSEMLDHEVRGIIAGYVIWLRESDKVIFVTATSLIDKMHARGSIDENTRGAISLGISHRFDPRQIFDRFGLKGWMQKEIDAGPKDPTAAGN